MLLVPLTSLSFASPGDEPIEVYWQDHASDHGVDRIRGGSDRSLLDRASQLGDDPDPLFATVLAPELAALESEGAWWQPAFGIRGTMRFAEGDMQPVGLLGDDEPGLFSLRTGVRLHGASDWIEVKAWPELRLDVLGDTGGVGFELEPQEYGIWLRRPHVRFGVGAEERRLGPGRRGGIALWDDAPTWPAASLQGEGPIWKLGHFRGEISAGVLLEERRDVQTPGLLHMDLRWSPHPWVELGASRVSLFWGEGRPVPPIGQLLLPTDPHIYDDEDQLEPDQDELACVDGRLTVPLDWGPVRSVEAWILYGAEDIIARSFAGIPYPSLAGVANQRGGEVAIDRFRATVEWSRFMDDYFRWYTGHRVYHEGFTSDGHVLGHPNGGDADTWWFAGAWLQDRWGGQAWAERLLRVDVADIVQDTVFTAMSDETRWRLGARGWAYGETGRRLELGAEVERIEGTGFVPGAQDLNHRVWIAFQTAGWSVDTSRRR